MKNTPPSALINWANSIESRNPELMTSLYSNNAILLATYEDIAIGHNEIYKYFIDFLDKQNLQCELLENYNENTLNNNVIIASGIYKFSFIDNYEEFIEVFARYSYVFSFDGLILNHHSSLLPSQSE